MNEQTINIELKLNDRIEVELKLRDGSGRRLFQNQQDIDNYMLSVDSTWNQKGVTQTHIQRLIDGNQ